MTFIKNVEIKVWEKAVEIKFAEWLLIQSVLKNFGKGLAKADIFKDQQRKDVNARLAELLTKAFKKSDTYTPLAGNIEAILGDAFAKKGARFSLIEMKDFLGSTTRNREWNSKAEDPSNKGRGAVYERLEKRDPQEKDEFKRISDECHFIMGLNENDDLPNGVSAGDIAFDSYWRFIKPGVYKQPRYRLDAFAEKGVSYEKFARYIDMLLADAQGAQQNELEDALDKAITRRESLKSQKDIDDADKKISSLRNYLEHGKHAPDWTMENMSVKVVAHGNGTIRAIDARFSEVKQGLVLAGKKLNTSPSAITGSLTVKKTQRSN